MKELVSIQTELKAPKNQVNKFGGYNYRSAEDIQEAAKKVMNKYNCYLVITDDIVMVGERVYVKATATITNSEGVSVSTSAFAREEESKKGMDASQITGSASSYARKYALNGLLCIDDARDADATNTHSKEKESAPVREDKMDSEFEDCANRDDLVRVWSKYKGTELEEQAKKALRKRKEELKIEK